MTWNYCIKETFDLENDYLIEQRIKMERNSSWMETTAPVHERIHDFSHNTESMHLGTEKWEICDDNEGSCPCACQDQDCR